MNILLALTALSLFSAAAPLTYESAPFKAATYEQSRYGETPTTLVNLGIMQVLASNNGSLPRKLEYVKKSSLQFTKLSSDLKSFVLDVSYAFDNDVSKLFVPSAGNDSVSFRAAFELTNCDNKNLIYTPSEEKNFENILRDFRELRIRESLYCEFRLNEVIGNNAFASKFNSTKQFAFWAYPALERKTFWTRVSNKYPKCYNNEDCICLKPFNINHASYQSLYSYQSEEEYEKMKAVDCKRADTVDSDIMLRISHDNGLIIFSDPRFLKPINYSDTTQRDFTKGLMNLSVDYRKSSDGSLSDAQRQELRTEIDRTLGVFYSYVDLLMIEKDSPKDQRQARLTQFFSPRLKENFIRSTDRINALLKEGTLIDIVDTHLRILGAHKYVKFFELKVAKQIVFDQEVEVRL